MSSGRRGRSAVGGFPQNTEVTAGGLGSVAIPPGELLVRQLPLSFILRLGRRHVRLHGCLLVGYTAPLRTTFTFRHASRLLRHGRLWATSRRRPGAPVSGWGWPRTPRPRVAPETP